MKHPNEDDLTLRFKAGDEKAFSSLFAFYRVAIIAFVARQFSSLDPDELAQETWINAWNKRERYSQNYGFGTWLFTIARRRGIDQLRRSNADERGKDRFKACREVTEQTCLYDTIQVNDLRKSLAECMAGLPAPQAHVMKLVGDGYSQREIARITSTPLGTVKTRCESGCRKMREVFIAHNTQGSTK